MRRFQGFVSHPRQFLALWLPYLRSIAKACCVNVEKLTRTSTSVDHGCRIQHIRYSLLVDGTVSHSRMLLSAHVVLDTQCLLPYCNTRNALIPSLTIDCLAGSGPLCLLCLLSSQMARNSIELILSLILSRYSKILETTF